MGIDDLSWLLIIYIAISYLFTRSIRPTKMKVLSAVLAFAGLYTLLLFVFADTIPPESMTRGAMLGAEFRIQNYVAQHHGLPEKLSDVPTRPDHDDRDIDGWGKPLLYAPQSDGSVVITSLGKEGANNKQSVRFSIIPSGDRPDEEAWTMTDGYMHFVEREIRNYAASHHQLPTSVDDIPGVDAAFTIDGWGRPIEYAPQPDGSVTLTSHGAVGSGQIFSIQFTVLGAKPVGPTAMATEPSDANKGR